MLNTYIVTPTVTGGPERDFKHILDFHMNLVLLEYSYYLFFNSCNVRVIIIKLRTLFMADLI